MRKFIVITSSIYTEQVERFIMAESPTQAALYSYMKIAEEIEEGDEELKTRTINKFKEIIKKVSKKEVSGEWESEEVGIDIINEVMGAEMMSIVTVAEIPDNPNYDVCLPVSKSELN